MLRDILKIPKDELGLTTYLVILILVLMSVLISVFASVLIPLLMHVLLPAIPADVLATHHCRFTGPWLPDSEDLEDEEALGLTDITR